MEISINLPNSLYQGVSHLAEVKQKSVGEIIKNAVRKAVTAEESDFAEQAKIIEQSIRFCSNEEVLALTNLQFLEGERLSFLFEKNRESVLTKKERAELTKAVALSRLNDLRKTFGIIEAKNRGLV